MTHKSKDTVDNSTSAENLTTVKTEVERSRKIDLGFKDESVNSVAKRFIPLVRSGKSPAEIAKMYGTTLRHVYNTLSEARHPEKYREKIAKRTADRLDIEYAENMVIKLMENGFVEEEGQGMPGWINKRVTSGILRQALADDGYRPFNYTLDTRIGGRGQRGVTAKMLIGEKVYRRFIVIDEDAFEYHKNNVLAIELLKRFYSSNPNPSVELRGGMTRLLHQNGMHVKVFCRHDWERMREVGALIGD